MSLDLLAGLPSPAPEAIKRAREAAGHSQEAAAHLVGLAGRLSWWRLENDKALLAPHLWALYLLATGQHPELVLTPR